MQARPSSKGENSHCKGKGFTTRWHGAGMGKHHLEAVYPPPPSSWAGKGQGWEGGGGVGWGGIIGSKARAGRPSRREG